MAAPVTEIMDCFANDSEDMVETAVLEIMFSKIL
jgi:hypothetical protein